MRKRLAVFAGVLGLLGSVLSAGTAAAGEVAIQDPVHPDCEYVVYWDTNPLDVGSEGRCQG
ncbi:MAG TPA: hypothetical protein VJ927_08800 [Actinomycetota bacterium]|nr:hypothetical protein [Actinomycetota bacterium]